MEEQSESQTGTNEGSAARHCYADTELIDFLERNPRIRFSYCEYPNRAPFWRRLFGAKDASNQFETLRAAISASVDHERHSA